MNPAPDLWSWSLAAYASPGAAEACLHLQEAQDHNVPYLLWAAWAAASARPLDAQLLESGADIARTYDAAVVKPLRVVRTTLKKAIADMDEAARLDLREQVKAVELRAERRLLEELERMSPDPSGPARRIGPALIDAGRAWGPVIPRVALETLAGKLPA